MEITRLMKARLASNTADIQALLGAGFSASDLRGAGFSASALRGAGFSASDLRGAGFSASALRGAGFSASDVLGAGFSASALLGAGFSASALLGAGFSASDVRGAGFSASDVLGAGFSASALRGAGFSASALRGAGFSASDVRGAGFSASDVLGAGFLASALHGAGFSASDLLGMEELEARIPLVEQPYTKMWADIQAGQRCHNQSTFGPDADPSTNLCKTQMCTAGHLVNMGGKAGYDLKEEFGFSGAAKLIHAKAHPGWPCQDFGMIKQEWALAYIEEMADWEQNGAPEGAPIFAE